MAITENEMNYHEKMFPGYNSDFIQGNIFVGR